MNKKEKKSNIDSIKNNAKKAESVLKILANSKRLIILCYLMKNEKTVGELAQLVGLSSSSISQHLAKMRALNLVETDKRGQEVFYKIENQEIEAILSTLCLIYCK